MNRGRQYQKVVATRAVIKGMCDLILALAVAACLLKCCGVI